MKLLWTLLWTLSSTAMASDYCKLKAVSASNHEDGITISIFEFHGMDFNSCSRLCKDEARLKHHIEAGQILLSCRLKHRAEDGTLIRMRYRFRTLSSLDES